MLQCIQAFNISSLLHSLYIIFTFHVETNIVLRKIELETFRIASVMEMRIISYVEGLWLYIPDNENYEGPHEQAYMSV